MNGTAKTPSPLSNILVSSAEPRPVRLLRPQEGADLCPAVIVHGQPSENREELSLEFVARGLVAAVVALPLGRGSSLHADESETLLEAARQLRSPSCAGVGIYASDSSCTTALTAACSSEVDAVVCVDATDIPPARPPGEKVLLISSMRNTQIASEISVELPGSRVLLLDAVTSGQLKRPQHLYGVLEAIVAFFLSRLVHR